MSHIRMSLSQTYERVMSQCECLIGQVDVVVLQAHVTHMNESRPEHTRVISHRCM